MSTITLQKLPKELLGLAGEYAVASEPCRRGVYAQLTMGHHKQTDILVETETKMQRIQVKAKQTPEWPGIPGLYRSDDFLILVDFKEKIPGNDLTSMFSMSRIGRALYRTLKGKSLALW